ncbi:DGAT1/2-independent enzyme synthesizing storage lipids-like [Watersipora subatra]|uniref:DGAT1/2-independent enzyme synthesizing storage lipids-like n=1 Tax=Watersipora subatra TaxID=2589382 RepID=UPI00355BCDA9
MSQCCSADEFIDGDTRSTFSLILSRMFWVITSSVCGILDFIYAQYEWLVGDILGFDHVLLLEYINLLYWPVVIFLVFPLMLLILLYASALFLTIYRWRSHLHEAYHKDFWDGARQTLAVLWEGQASLWHGYAVEGLENIPDKGPALLIYYHGALPIDIYYLISKIYLYKQRLIHPIGDKCLFYVPGFQRLMKVFQVQPGTVEGCTKLLKEGNIVAIAPGGIREALFSHNYDLLWNKRLGFAKVAIASKAPIIPIFTKNTRQAINTLPFGADIFKYIYEKTKWPLSIFYGVFPVKLVTYIGTPIDTSGVDVHPQQLSHQVCEAIEDLRNSYQRPSGSILLALLDRFT